MQEQLKGLAAPSSQSSEHRRQDTTTSAPTTKYGDAKRNV